MQLWQMDIVGGVFLADGRECKIVTGIDDHSRYIVIAHVVVVPTGRAVAEAFVAAMRRYGVPSEVLTDNGKQFTGRFTRPFPAEVLFERVCRENGISQRFTKRRSPTTTGKIERFHATLRTELLNEVTTFATLDQAQEAISAWVSTYNEARPHQSLEMATPATRFRPNPPQPLTVNTADWQPQPPAMPEPDHEQVPAVIDETVGRPSAAPTAIEWEATVPPRGIITIASAQSLWLGPVFAGRVVTLWADSRSIHVLLDGHHLKTVPSRLNSEHLHHLAMRGAHPAGAAPAAPALPSTNGRRRLPDNTAVEVERTVSRDGVIRFRAETFTVEPNLTGQRITLRFDGHLMHAIAENTLVRSWPYPITLEQRLKLVGARQADSAPPQPPSTAQRAERRVPRDGVIMVARQRLRIGTTHAGKIVTILVEDTHFRVLDGDHELATHPRTTNHPVTRVKAWSRTQNNGNDLPRTKG